MAITAEEATEAYREFRPFDLPAGHRHVARAVGGSTLWSVATVDEHGRAYLGSYNLVGPDKRVWAFSSNPGIHDPDLVAASLERLYQAGLADRVEPEHLAARVRELTDARQEALREVLRSAEAGELRDRPPRNLP